jgi:hypothetical protein
MVSGPWVISDQCERLEEGSSNELVKIWNCKGIYKCLVRRARLPAGQHARAARGEVKLP